MTLACLSPKCEKHVHRLYGCSVFHTASCVTHGDTHHNDSRKRHPGNAGPPRSYDIFTLIDSLHILSMTIYDMNWSYSLHNELVIFIAQWTGHIHYTMNWSYSLHNELVLFITQWSGHIHYTMNWSYSLHNELVIFITQWTGHIHYTMNWSYSLHNELVIFIAQWTYLDTWSGFEAAKTAPWQSRGLHQCGTFLEPSDEWAGRGCYCFLMRWHSWAFLADQGWCREICRAPIWIFQF